MASIGTSQPVDGSSLLDELRAEEAQRLQSKSNTLKFHGNRSTMNLNPLILTNIQNSPYYKNNVTPLETFEEVVDEIFHRVYFYVVIFNFILFRFIYSFYLPLGQPS